MILITCPNCGERNVAEFRFGGECKKRPANLYLKENRLGLQQEWWYHRAGCGRWFIAERHTQTQMVEKTYFWEPGQ